MGLYDDNNKTVDIPDFVEEKDETTSSSIDMSIFKMSDDELYDDVPKKKEKVYSQEPSAPKKKSNAALILCLIFMLVFLATSVVSLIYAVKEHNEANDLRNKYSQLETIYNDTKANSEKLEAKVAELEKKIQESTSGNTVEDPNNKYPKGTVLYITEEGSIDAPQGVRKKPSVDADTVTDSNGNNVLLFWGYKVTLAEDATKDADGNYWAKISEVIDDDGKTTKIDTGYMRIEWDGEIWASKEEQ